MPQGDRLRLKAIRVELQANGTLHACGVDVRLGAAVHLPALAQHHVPATLHHSQALLTDLSRPTCVGAGGCFAFCQAAPNQAAAAPTAERGALTMQVQGGMPGSAGEARARCNDTVSCHGARGRVPGAAPRP